MEVFICGAVGRGISLPEVAKVDLKPGVSLSDVTIFPCSVVSDLAKPYLQRWSALQLGFSWSSQPYPFFSCWHDNCDISVNSASETSRS